MKKKTTAQGLVEYALLITLAAAAALLALRAYGFTLEQVYCNISARLGSQTCALNYCGDDFASGAEGWNAGNNRTPPGNWDFSSDGQLCAHGTGAIYNTCSEGIESGDYTINIDQATLFKGNGYGVFFRSTVENGKVNGYTFQYDPGLKAFVFRKWVDGRELPPLASAPAPKYDWYGEPHKIQVKVSGDTFTAYVDGVPVLTGSDSTYSEGGVGLRSWDSTDFCMDSFSVGPNQP
jgi:hypothetical protein